MNALVTGANGLVGATLVRELLAAGHSARSLVRPSSDLRSLAGVTAKLVPGDILQLETLNAAAQGCDVIFHTASIFAYQSHRVDELTQTALEGTQNVLAAAQYAGIRRVVLTSSSVTCGSDTAPVVRDETFHLEEPDAPPYIVVKAKQERLAFDQARARGIELVAVCPTIVVGPHDYRLGPSNGLIVAYLTDPFRLTYPGGCNIVGVTDIARGHILAATHGRPGERYLLGAENLEWSALHGLISTLCGIAGPYVYANHTASYLAAATAELVAMLTQTPALTTRTQAKMVGRYYWYSHQKASNLGYAPQSARQALATAIAWLITSPHVSRQLRSTLRLTRQVYQARRMLTPDPDQHQASEPKPA